MDHASLGAMLRHKLRLLLDRATNDDLDEFGKAVIIRDLTATVWLRTSGRALSRLKSPDRQRASQVRRKLQGLSWNPATDGKPASAWRRRTCILVRVRGCEGKQRDRQCRHQTSAIFIGVEVANLLLATALYGDRVGVCRALRRPPTIGRLALSTGVCQQTTGRRCPMSAKPPQTHC